MIWLESNGQIIEGDENLLKHATEYYFSYLVLVMIVIFILTKICGPITDEENDELCKPFSEEEIKYALFK